MVLSWANLSCAWVTIPGRKNRVDHTLWHESVERKCGTRFCARTVRLRGPELCKCLLVMTVVHILEQIQRMVAATRSFVFKVSVRHVLRVAIVVAAMNSLGTVTATADTLREALADTYTYNPRIDAERARLRATDESVPEARSGYRPQVNGSADVNYQNTNVRPDSESEGVTTPKGYQVGLTQNIFDGFQTTSRVAEAEASVRAGRESLRDIERTVLLEAVGAYMDVVRDQAIVRLRENNVRVLSRELQATQERFAVGEVTQTDVAQARARRAGAVSALQLARANLKTSRAGYQRVVGSPPSNLAVPPLPNRSLPKSLQSAISTGLNENPIFIAALYREQGARHTVDRIRGELLPSVNFEANYQSRFDSSRFTDQSETTTITGRVNVPIYQGGAVSARVRAAKHTHVASLQDIEDARTRVRQDVTSAWAQLQANNSQIQSDRTQVSANQTALNGVREEERVGQRTLLDVFNAELELLNAQVQLETTRRNQVVAAYSLLSSIGRLDAISLSLTSQSYDPDAHYHEVRRQWWGIDITHDDGRAEHIDLWESHGQHSPYK